MKKKLFSILLSLAMALTMIPFATMTAFAEDDSESFSKCITYKAVKDIAGKYTLKLKTKDVGEFAFQAVGEGWYIQDAETEKYLGVNNCGKLTKDDIAKTVWTYKNHSFSTKYSKKVKGYLLAVKKTAYLSCDNNNEVTTSCVYALAEVCKKTVRDNHLNTLFLNKKDGEHHVVICARCGAKTVQEHCYGLLNKRCICGAKKSKEDKNSITIGDMFKSLRSKKPSTSNPWKGKVYGYNCYVVSNKMMFAEHGVSELYQIPCTTTVKFINDAYVCSAGDVKITFYRTNGVLTSLTVEGCSITKVNDTYKPANSMQYQIND